MRLLDAICNRPWLITPEAMETILSVVTREQADHDLAAQIRAARAERPAAVAMRAGVALPGADGVTVRDGVAHIGVIGPITRYSDLFSQVSGLASVEQIAAGFQAALDSPDVRAILLEFDTPGGEVTGIAALGEAIYAARQVKPVRAYVDGMAASAGYWLASSAGHITTDPAGLLGSIGAVLAVRDPARGPQGRSIEFVSSQSPHKRANPTTDAGRAQYQRIVDQTAEAFIEAVARNRGVSSAHVVERYGAGGVMVGRHAVEAGLADRVGTFEQALAALANMAGRRPARTYHMAGLVAAAQEDEPMKLREMIAAVFGGAADAGLIASDGTPEPVAASIVAAQPVAEDAPADPDADTLTRAAIERDAAIRDAEAARAALAEAQARERQAAVARFVENAIGTGRALPAERDALTALYTRAQGAGIAAEVEALIAARPPHALRAELVPAAPATALPVARGADKGLTDDRRRELLAATPEGRAALAAKK